MSKTKPKQHYHNELINDIGSDFISNQTMFKWFEERYSTSKHLLTLYSIAKGLNAKSILEIGFGRSTFILAKVAIENEGLLTTCDIDDFSSLLSVKEKHFVKYVNASSNEIWKNEDIYDFAFLDYFSSKSLSTYFCYKEIKNCIKKIKKNSIIAIHDTYDNRYAIRRALTLIRLTSKVDYITLPYNYGLSLLRYTGNTHNGMLEDQFIKKV